ncbi:hypothetical protein CK203_111512 [Vitis vinifera]|uniref:Uncharacterized protein n=1 Tax=Vitis vinifera TaxID=29760 RepID=A0A438C938_VITVI|nr:hypothetical protein CK203_111512 [Vitis vinifera]
MPAVREMFGDQANVIGQFKPNNNASYGNTYNSNWRNHPNFSWKPRAPQYTQPGQAPRKPQILNKPLLTISTQCKRKENFLLNLIKIPRVSMKWRLRRRIFQMREVKAVITLRSGKEVDLPTSKPEQERIVKKKKKEGGNQRKGKRTVQRRRTLKLV